MKLRQNFYENHEERNQPPLWQLCKKSLTTEQNMKEIRSFLKNLKPKSIHHIEKHVVLTKILNFLFVIEMTFIGSLFSQSSQWGICQYLFCAFLIFKIWWFGQKRCKKQLYQESTPKQIQNTFQSEKDKPLLLKTRLNGIIQSLQGLTSKFEWIFRWTYFGLTYFLYRTIQENLYFPSQKKLILFTIMILFGQSHEESPNSIKLSQLVLLTHNFEFYWMGLCSLILNNHFDLEFEKQNIYIRERSQQKETVEIVFGVSAFFLLILFTEQSIKWFVILLIVWVLIKFIENIDRECLSLKKKYKDEGVMNQITQYH